MYIQTPSNNSMRLKYDQPLQTHKKVSEIKSYNNEMLDQTYNDEMAFRNSIEMQKMLTIIESKYSLSFLSREPLYFIFR